MATINGLTAERMQEIIDSTIVGAHIDGDNLILELFDSSEINAGNVRGATGAVGPQAETGDTMWSIRTSKAGWLMFGTSVPNADTLHPALWALVPAGWKSGSTLNLPSMADTIFQGDNGSTAIGDITGANTVVIDDGQLPPHTHTGPSHNHTGPNHNHTMDHNHPAFTTDAGGGHDHQGFLVGYTAPSAGGTWFVRRATDGAANGTAVGSTGSAHTHDIDIPNYTGATGLAGTGVTSLSGTGATGPGPGASTPLSIEQRAMRMNCFIKT